MRAFSIIAVFVLVFSGCGWKEVQLAYYDTVQKQLQLEARKNTDPQPLINLELDDKGRVKALQVADQTRRDVPVQVLKPDKHPVYGLVGTVLTSPVAGIVAGGYAGKMLMQEAGTRMINSGNTAGGDIGTGYEGDVSFDKSVNDSYNDSSDHSDHSVASSHNDSSDNSDHSIVDSYNDNSATDSHDDNSVVDSHDDNSVIDSHDDNRHDYGNDYRQNYDNPVEVVSPDLQ